MSKQQLQIDFVNYPGMFLFLIVQSQLFSPDVTNGQVHLGFYESWNALKPGVINSVKKLASLVNFRKILITGHSLGGATLENRANCKIWFSLRIGALAQLCALSIADNNIRPFELIVYTYGSPRWADKIVAYHFDRTVTQHFRIVYKNDIVPSLPNEGQGYKHTGKDQESVEPCLVLFFDQLKKFTTTRQRITLIAGMVIMKIICAMTTTTPHCQITQIIWVLRKIVRLVQQ